MSSIQEAEEAVFNKITCREDCGLVYRRNTVNWLFDEILET